MFDRIRGFFRKEPKKTMSHDQAVRLVREYIKPTRNRPYLNAEDAAQGAVEILTAVGLIEVEKSDRRGA